MRLYKFNKFERIAGIFVLACIVGFLGSMIGVAVKQGWFETKVYFKTSFHSGDGVHPGTVVQIQGLKAGAVDSVELKGNNQVQVTFYVYGRFEDKVRVDSMAQLIRPFVIGERILEVSVGTEGKQKLLANSEMKSEETMDLLSLLGGKELGSSLKAMSGMAENLKAIIEAFLDKNRTQALISSFDRIDPLLKNLNTMSIEVVKLAKQANKNEQLGEVLHQLTVTTREINQILPALNRESPHLAKDVSKLLGNLSLMTEEFKVVLPALAEVAPDLPKTSRRAVEALDEAVVLIKAIEKSFFVRGNAREVREEEAQREKERSNRRPASHK